MGNQTQNKPQQGGGNVNDANRQGKDQPRAPQGDKSTDPGSKARQDGNEQKKSPGRDNHNA